MSLVISDEIVKATGMSEEALSVEIAVLLFAEDKLTLGQASKLARMHQLDFQRLLASREITIHYDVDEFRKDLKTLNELRGS